MEPASPSASLSLCVSHEEINKILKKKKKKVVKSTDASASLFTRSVTLGMFLYFSCLFSHLPNVDNRSTTLIGLLRGVVGGHMSYL